jgi:hypothetical protein
MDVLWVEKEDGHAWELCRVASALGTGVYMKKNEIGYEFWGLTMPL